MSYDVQLNCECCGNLVLDANHTSNTARIWRELGVDLAQWNGWKAEAAIEPLTNAIYILDKRPEDFRHHEPPNGWGTVETTRGFLEEIRAACDRFPGLTLHVGH